MSAAPYPLADLRVLDLSRVMSGPYAGRLLADLGAEVVKIEPPEGDITRQWGGVRHGLSGFYTQQNAGKRNVCIDLKRDGGRELVRELASRADCLLENFRPGVMRRFGLDYATLAERNPGLIMLSISGFGQTGPEVDRPVYAPVIHAEAGYIARHAELNEERPSDPIFSIADSYSALHGLVALLSALHLRARTGRGQHIDLAMLRALVSTDDYTHHLLDEEWPIDPLGGQVFDAPGGPILISGQWKSIWYQAKHVLGLRAEPSDDPRQSLQNKQAAVRAHIAAYPSREALVRDLERARLPWGEVRSPAAVLASPSLPPDTFGEVDDRGGGTRRVTQAPYRFSGARAGVRGPGPRRGEHNAAVLRDWLALEHEEIEALERAQVLLCE